MNHLLRRGALVLAACVSVNAFAQDKIKVGLLTTLSGPGAALGVDIRDAFQLALEHLDGKLGGAPAEVIVVDDAQNPDTARQSAERLLKRDKVDVMTGIVFSNIMLAVGPTVFAERVPYVSANAGPSELAGEKCNPYFFVASWQNDNLHEAMGKHATDRGYKRAYLLAPNYPAGKDALTGFKRFYKGEIAGEVYTKLQQLDYAAEIAQLRAAKPDSVYIFLPGGMGVAFIKQYAQAGLIKDVPLLVPGFSGDEDIVRAVGEPMIGTYNSTHWYREMDNAANRRFVADFEKKYGRAPTLYASQGYDAALMIDTALKATGGKASDRAALAKALAKGEFVSLRGPIKLNGNHFPIQNYYLRQVVKDASGKVGNKIVGPIMSQHADAYAAQCKMTAPN